jgi:hypothetical protein
MQRYTVYLYLETALHVPGGKSTHHQEHSQLYLQHLVLVKPLLLPAAIVKDLELCSKSSTIAAGSCNGLTSETNKGYSQLYPAGKPIPNLWENTKFCLILL